jgi:hypothetical protein
MFLAMCFITLPATSNAQITIQEKLRTAESGYAARIQDMRNNRDNNRNLRNAVIESRRVQVASTTDLELGRVFPTGLRMGWRDASPAGSGGIEHPQQARLEQFAAMQNNLVEQLTRSIDNLSQIRDRIADRIQTESVDGYDMSTAISLLATADAKIQSAATAAQSIDAYMPTTKLTAESASSTTIDLSQPRAIGGNAIQAVADAQQALNAVVASIAGSLGVKLENNL